MGRTTRSWVGGVVAAAVAACRAEMLLPSYRGRHNLVGDAKFGRCQPSSAKWFLRNAGRSSPALAQLVRFVSGHFQHGAFRERFHLDGARQCWCGETDLEDREGEVCCVISCFCQPQLTYFSI